ncbi:hypothetical protein PR202_gb28697 [Eleusine coracana subsp. coracana]|uniref:DUF2428 domain-containing protein n=1 Tax=Eleusine coracana subsp. coracana TaxID=191504 RepID=A0AAV5FX30_ELECO|nr:hypothetical protein PR202_gb28697 [Eleusine coracana subsp. coracana]
MSAKWRSQQHRHRYTYTSVVFPRHYLEGLALVPSEVASSNFFVQLNNLISLTSTYSQVVAVKDLASAYVQFLSAPGTPDDAALAATKFYLEILFFENSLPLHRTLISVLAKCKKFFPVISGCFVSLCEEYGGSASKAKKRFMRYPSKFTGLDEASSVFKSAVRTILAVLKSSAFSRDCLVASGVSFCAALQVFMSPEEICRFISQGLFGISAANEDRKDLSLHNVLSDSDLCEEVRDLSVLSRLCLLRGILTSIPSIFAMLGFISIGPSAKATKLDVILENDQRIAALVSLLKVSRNLALVEGDIDLDSDTLSQSLGRMIIRVKQGSWIPSLTSSVKGPDSVGTADATVIQRAEDLFQFMKWLSSFLFNSCYPSGPYERKTIAMELILTLLDVWPLCLSEGKNDLYPYNDSITLPDSTISFVGSIVDSWDRLRENSFRILLQFPTPLPGISLSPSINDVIRWAKKLVLSPRVRESDAGALTFRLIFRKYVLELGCILMFSKESDCLECCTESLNGDTEVTTIQNPVAQYISSLIEWLCTVVEEGERNLSEACKKSFVHGVLLTIRYTFDELDWNSEVVQLCVSEMRCLVEKLLQLIVRITSLALWVVSSDAWYMPYDMDDVIDDGPFLSDMYEGQPNISSEIETAIEPGNNAKPAEHVVMVGCWLAMKEVSLLFGTIIRKVPLPGCSHSNSSRNGLTINNEETNASAEVLDVEQLETMGEHFLQVLLKMKHNGAIDKTRAGLTALCNRLLCSNDSRRSAGIPAAFIALFLAEPEGTPKKLLPRALEWLIEFAKTSLTNLQKDYNKKSEVMTDDLRELCESQSETAVSVHSNGNLSKIRDEGVVPTVHVFNVLRAAFNDANLATDTSGFSAEATIVAVQAFSSPYWEVRNAACLAYTALVRRMVGFLNVQKRESARRSLTGLEFFHRQVHNILYVSQYGTQHFILSLLVKLRVATDLLADGHSSTTKHTEVIQALLLESSSQCLNATTTRCVGFSKKSDETSEEDVQLQVLGEQTSFMSEMSREEITLPEVHKEITLCLADPTYDVRITVLKRILQLTKSMIHGDSTSVLHRWAQANLQPALMEQFNEGNRLSDAMLGANFFVSLVKNQSEPSQTVNARRAAAEAIIASGLLEEASFVASFVSDINPMSSGVEADMSQENSFLELGSAVLDLLDCTCTGRFGDENGKEKILVLNYIDYKIHQTKRDDYVGRTITQLQTRALQGHTSLGSRRKSTYQLLSA